MKLTKKKKKKKASLTPEQVRENNLCAFLDDVTEKDKEVVRMTGIKKSLIIPTNMVSYNRASVVGGLVTGGSYSLCGKSQGGKTLFGIIACNAFADTGYPSYYVDAETTGDQVWFKALQMDLSKGLYLVPRSLEHAAEKVFEFIDKVSAFRKKNKDRFPAIVIIDSYNKVRPEKELEKSEINGRKYPYHAACFTDWMNKLTYKLYHEDIIVMVIRHDRANMNRTNDYEPDTVASGAQTLNHDSTLTVRFNSRATDTVERNKKKITFGYWHDFKIEKSKDGIKDEVGKFYISNGKGYVPLGFCPYKTAIEEGVYQEVFKRKKGGGIIDGLREKEYSKEEDLWTLIATDEKNRNELFQYLNNYWERVYGNSTI